MNISDLSDRFSQYFTLVFANTDVLKHEAFKIRHKVFAEELNFEPINPAGVESDEYDPYSYHYLLKHQASNDYAGTVRLIMSPTNQDDFKLPFEQFCHHGIDHSIINPNDLAPGSYAEVSRLAVPNSFRRRAGEKGQAVVLRDVESGKTREQSDRYPYVPIGLYLVCSALFRITQLEYIFVMIEPRLARHMSRFGIAFAQAGPPIEYHGRRALYYITQESLEQHLKPEMRALLDTIQAQVEEDIEPPLQSSSLKA